MRQLSFALVAILVVNGFLSAKAQTGKKTDKQQLLITGSFAKTMALENFDYMIGEDAMAESRLNNNTGRHQIAVVNNTFRIERKGLSVDTYFNFRYDYDKANKYKVSLSKTILSANNWLFPPSGKIMMTISKDTILFEGTGADLLRCQYEMFAYQNKKNEEIIIPQGNVLYKLVEEKVEGTVHMPFYQGLVQQHKNYQEILEGQMRILERYRSAIGEPLYKLLKYDQFGKIKKRQLIDLQFKIDIGLASRKPQLRSTILQLYKDYFWFNPIDFATDSTVKLNAPSYIDYLYTKAREDLYIALMANSSRPSVSFEDLYEKIIKEFPAFYHEKMISNIFQAFAVTNNLPGWGFKDALERVQDLSVRQYIEHLKSTRGVGVPVYDFKLTDTSGKKVSLADLRGKVLLVDFWYTGCHGCASLAKNMEPIFEYFKGNDKVVFVGINADKDMEKWKKSVREGIYTHPGSLSLYTNGEGTSSELIAHYNILAYPTMMIIDGEGRMVAFNPPWPLIKNPARKNRFVSLIEEQVARLK